jgi:hypothetical protein
MSSKGKTQMIASFIPAIFKRSVMSTPPVGIQMGNCPIGTQELYPSGLFLQPSFSGRDKDVDSRHRHQTEARRDRYVAPPGTSHPNMRFLILDYYHVLLYSFLSFPGTGPPLRIG